MQNIYRHSSHQSSPSSPACLRLCWISLHFTTNRDAEKLKSPQANKLTSWQIEKPPLIPSEQPSPSMSPPCLHLSTLLRCLLTMYIWFKICTSMPPPCLDLSPFSDQLKIVIWLCSAGFSLGHWGRELKQTSLVLIYLQERSYVAFGLEGWSPTIGHKEDWRDLTMPWDLILAGHFYLEM